MVARTIGEFVLRLSTDEEAATAYRADPVGALRAAGLGALSPADLTALAPAVAESALLGVRGHRLPDTLTAESIPAPGDDAQAIEKFSPYRRS